MKSSGKIGVQDTILVHLKDAANVQLSTVPLHNSVYCIDQQCSSWKIEIELFQRSKKEDGIQLP
jgi:hypothetical protein